MRLFVYNQVDSHTYNYHMYFYMWSLYNHHFHFHIRLYHHMIHHHLIGKKYCHLWNLKQNLLFPHMKTFVKKIFVFGKKFTQCCSQSVNLVVLCKFYISNIIYFLRICKYFHVEWVNKEIFTHQACELSTTMNARWKMNWNVRKLINLSFLNLQTATKI